MPKSLGAREYAIALAIICASAVVSLLLSSRYQGNVELAMALLLAGTSALFVVGVFMDLVSQRGSNRLTLFVAGLLLFTLVLLTTLDVKTRETVPPAPQPPSGEQIQ